MNEFDKMDREWEEDPGPEQVLPEKLGPAPEPWSQPETTAEPVLTGPQTEPEAEEAGPPEPPEQESFTPAEPRGEGSAPGAAQEAAGPASQEGSFFQGSGSYYTQPQQPPQPQNWGWQGQYGQYSPGWQQGGPRTTGWQQPGPRTTGWQQPGPRTTGWQQPGPQWWYPGGPAATGWQQPQQNPWQAGGYRPQGGQQVPGQWQGPPAPENAPPPKKKRGALKGFLIFLGVAAALAVVVMAGYGIYAATTGRTPWLRQRAISCRQVHQEGARPRKSICGTSRGQTGRTVTLWTGVLPTVRSSGGFLRRWSLSWQGKTASTAKRPWAAALL